MSDHDQNWVNTVVRIPVYSDGWIESWQDVVQFLHAFRPDPLYHSVTFDVREGVSLTETGVVTLIQRWQHSTGYPDSQILLRCGNTMEQLPWSNVKHGVNMNFFNQARVYHRRLPVQPDAKRFAMFVGRLTIERLCVMYDMARQFADQCLISHLQQPENLPMTFVCSWPEWQPKQRDEAVWRQYIQDHSVCDWYRNHTPASIDNAKATDQYTSMSADHTHNRLHAALLPHYDKFFIELVAETMLYGNTFWPTEKIARPLAAAKPFVCFAAPGFVQRLRCLGFQTFDSLWDESYDNLQGRARWLAIQDVVTKLAALDDQCFADLMHEAQQIADHNYEVLLNNFPIYNRDLDSRLQAIYH